VCAVLIERVGTAAYWGGIAYGVSLIGRDLTGIYQPSDAEREAFVYGMMAGYETYRAQTTLQAWSDWLDEGLSWNLSYGPGGPLVGHSDPTDLFMPGGRPIGRPGSTPRTREVYASEATAQAFWDDVSMYATRSTTTDIPNGPIYRVDFADGGWASFRTWATRSGDQTIATIQVERAGVTFNKVKFNLP